MKSRGYRQPGKDEIRSVIKGVSQPPGINERPFQHDAKRLNRGLANRQDNQATHQQCGHQVDDG